MKKLKELLGRVKKRIDKKRLNKCLGCFFLICAVVVLFLPIDEIGILNLFQKGKCDPMIGTLFFEDYVWPDDAEIEIESVEIQMDKDHNFKEIRADENKLKYFFSNYQTVIVQMTVCKVEEGKPQVRVSGSAILTLRNKFPEIQLFSLKRTDERPIYSCLQAPEKPEDMKEELEDLLSNKQVEITKFTVNDAKNRIDVEYTQHIEGGIFESKDLYKRTFYYYGYSNTWIKEGEDLLLDRKYINDNIEGTYLCEYHDKELEVIFSKDNMVSVIYDGYKYIGNVMNTKYTSFQEVPKSELDILMKYTDIDLSFSKPQYIIRITGGPNGTFETLNNTEHQLIFLLVDMNNMVVYLPDEGNDLERYGLFEEDNWNLRKSFK